LPGSLSHARLVATSLEAVGVIADCCAVITN